MGDGERLSLAITRLHGPLNTSIASGFSIRPRVAIPLRIAGRRCRRPASHGADKFIDGSNSAAPKVIALHVSPQGQLWVLLRDGNVVAWDLSKMRLYGVWRARWQHVPGNFQPAAICSDQKRGLYAAGLNGSGHPTLLWGEYT